MVDESIVTEVVTIVAAEMDKTPSKGTAYLKCTDHLGRDLSLYDQKAWGTVQANVGSNFECEIKGPASKFPALRKLEKTDKPVTQKAEEYTPPATKSSGGGGGGGKPRDSKTDRSIERQVALKEVFETVRLMLGLQLLTREEVPAEAKKLFEVADSLCSGLHMQLVRAELAVMAKDAQQRLGGEVEMGDMP